MGNTAPRGSDPTACELPVHEEPAPRYPYPRPPRRGLARIPPWAWILVAVVLAINGFLVGVETRLVGSRNPSVSKPDSTTAPMVNPPSPRAPDAATVPPATPGVELPWIAKVRSNCARYENAPNDIQRSAIFRENHALLAQTTVSGARGKLTMISTNQGGGELKLTVQMAKVKLTTESLFSPILRGSPVYTAAAEMKEGQCVVFSATRLAPASFFERAQVCDLEYFAEFTSLAPCR